MNELWLTMCAATKNLVWDGKMNRHTGKGIATWDGWTN